MSSTTPRSPVAIGVALAVASLVALPLTLSASPASAEVDTPSRVVLTGVTGAVVGRTGPPSAVSAVATNRGDAVAVNVAVRYQLPAGIEFATTAGCTESATIVTCRVGSLNPGATAPVTINVAETTADAALGQRAGYFFAPTTDEFDPGAGEVLLTEWNHEAGQESTDLQTCWPLSNATPNMDVSGGGCDGVTDAAPLAPDARTLFAAFPPAFNQQVVRSWQFETEFTAPLSADYRACGLSVDDGGYIAITPAGTGFSSGSIVASTPGFGSFASPTPFPLNAGQRYRVLIRVSNRGGLGVDNGDSGFGGWLSFGVADAAVSCNASDATVFGTSDLAWIDRYPADVEVRGTTDLAITGTIVSAAVSGARRTSVRMENLGTDPTDAAATVELGAGSTAIDGVTGCVVASGATTARCGFGVVAGGSTSVAAVRFRGPGLGVQWRATPTSAIDVATTNNIAPR